MKKHIWVILFVLFTLVLTGQNLWATRSKGSGQLSVDTIISSSPCKLTSIQVLTNGTNAATVTLYDDNNAATDREVISVIKVAAGSDYDGRYWIPARQTSYGLYADVTGTGASYIIDTEY